MTIRHLYPAVEPSLNLDFANSKKLDSRITFTRGSTATYTDESGIIRTAAQDEARFDHDSDGNSLGLLIEESRTNNTNNSEVLTDTGGGVGAWTANATTAPDGNSTADLWIPVSGFVDRNAATLSNSINGNNSVLTASVFVKKKELRYAHIAFLSSATYYTRLFDLDTGEFVKEYSFGSPTQTSSTVTALPNGWYRLSVSKYVSNTETTARLQVGSTDVSNPSHPYGQVTYVADGTSGMYFWGAQLEQGTFPTSYIPTSGSTVTRAADVASMTGTNFSSWYNSSEGSFFAESKLLGFSNFAFTASVNGSDGYIDAPHRRQTDSVFYSVLHGPPGNTNQVLLVSQTTSLTSTSKAANAFRVNDYAYCLNGGTVLVDNLLNLPTPTSLSIGGQNGNYLLNGHISRFTYYPTRLPDATLQALTL
jgi:hypothetical protein